MKSILRGFTVINYTKVSSISSFSLLKMGVYTNRGLL